METRVRLPVVISRRVRKSCSLVKVRDGLKTRRNPLALVCAEWRKGENIENKELQLAFDAQLEHDALRVSPDRRFGEMKRRSDERWRLPLENARDDSLFGPAQCKSRRDSPCACDCVDLRRQDQDLICIRPIWNRADPCEVPMRMPGRKRDDGVHPFSFGP